MTKGFDSAVTTAGIIDKIVAAGVGFVGRYHSRNPRKNLTLAEAGLLSKAGISIVSVWEAMGDQRSNFNAAQGGKDAIAALTCAANVQQPENSTIYFAVDFDASLADLANRIIPYFEAVAPVLAATYRVGVYGSGRVCEELETKGYVHHTWLGGAMGWANSRAYDGWNIKQGLPGDPYHLGFQVDPDEARGADYGQWQLPQGVAV